MSRSLKKGPYINVSLEKKILAMNESGKKSVVTKLNDGAAIEVDGPIEGDVYYIVDGKYYTQAYARILIRKKR